MWSVVLQRSLPNTSIISAASDLRSMEPSLTSALSLLSDVLPELDCAWLLRDEDRLQSRDQNDFMNTMTGQQDICNLAAGEAVRGFSIGALQATIPAMVSLTPHLLIVNALG